MQARPLGACEAAERVALLPIEPPLGAPASEWSGVPGGEAVTKLEKVELLGRLAWLALTKRVPMDEARVREVERLARIFIEEGRSVALSVEYADALVFREQPCRRP